MDAGTNVEALLEHADWVRALARTLVADSSSAEDVEQEAWLAALRHPPRDATNPRGWLGTVVRNAARKLARERVRRTAREADVAREEALPSAAELVEQTNLQRELAGLVVELDEPYRSTLLLRFFQGLEAAEIAARTGVPVATVRTRVQRGLASLREKLDRRHGARATWLAALAPLTPIAKSPTLQGSAVAGLGAWIMAVNLKWAVAASVAIAVGAWWLGREPDALATPPTESERTSVALVEPPAETRIAESTPTEPARSAVAASPQPELFAAPVGTLRIAGRCIGVDGAPLAGFEFEYVGLREARVEPSGTVRIGESWITITAELEQALRVDPEMVRGFEAEFPGYVGVREALLGEPFARPRVVSAADGAFAYDAEPDPEGEVGTLEPVGDAWVLVGTLRDALDPLPLHVFAQSVVVAGDVVDATGTPLANGSVELNLGLQRLDFGARRLTQVQQAPARVGSVDVAGRFRIERAPGIAGAVLHAWRDDGDGRSWHARAPIDGRTQLDLHLVAELQEFPRFATIRGTVVDENGAPMQGADVRFGQDSARCDDRGAFELRVSFGPSASTSLTALVRGKRPAALADFERELVQGGERADVRLVVGEPLAPIRGRVLDVDGTPAVGWKVDLADGTPFGSSTSTLEGFASGRNGPGVAVAPDGSFEFGGLLEREYRVRAWNPATMAELVSAPLRAGERVELRATADLVLARIAGRVLSTSGEPLQGVSVRCGLVVAKTAGLSESIHRNAQTDADGRFELQNVARAAQITLRGEGIAAQDVVLEPSADLENLTLVARRELRFRLELVESDPADRYAVENAAGERLNMIYETPDLKSGGRVLGRVHGSFPLTIVPEEATTLVLLQGETVLRKVPLQLRWRELTVVTP